MHQQLVQMLQIELILVDLAVVVLRFKYIGAPINTS